MQVITRPLQKVTAFITRQTNKGQELLVFMHPFSGVQLPAGTVEPNEPPEKAVLRETREETGLTIPMQQVVKLGMVTFQYPSDEGVLLQDAMLQSTPQHDATLMRHILTRGLTVEVGQRFKGFARVTYRETDKNGNDRTCQTGWVPESSLGSQLERHLFHLKVADDTPDRWSHIADHGYIFELYWVSLDSDPGLHPIQADWLKAARGYGL